MHTSMHPRTLIRFLTVAILAALLPACTEQHGDPVRPEAVQLAGGGEVPVEYIGLVSTNRLSQLMDDIDGNLIQHIEEENLIQFTSPTGLVPLQGDPRFELLQENTEHDGSDIINMMVGFTEVDIDQIHDDLDPGITPTSAGTPNNLACMDLPAIHAVADGAGVRVAIIDTGVDRYHPDLVDRLEIRPAALLDVYEATSNGLDDDGDGRVDEGFGHGTFVAGVIAQIAPEATLIPFAAFNDDGAATALHIVTAMIEADKADADIVNMSFRIDDAGPVIRHYLHRLHDEGVFVIAAGGNTAGGSATFPGSDPHTIGVAATRDCDNAMAAFSAHDGSDLMLAAIGEQVVSTYPSATPGQARYAYAHGTSTAAAVASGSFAVVQSLGAPDAYKAIKWNSAPVNPTGSVLYGAIDLAAAIGLTP